MNSEFEMARRAATQAQVAVNDLQRKLDNMVSSCQHEWGEIQYKPIYKKGYTDPGDPPGTMGIDWRGPVYIPPVTTPRWMRTCKICGKEESTTRSTQHSTSRPVF